eukprot:m.243413 g.243413  ORF g.243413 m.243413 type:complete len:122 (+) comp17141_c2_seq7:436-801(+)
MCRHVDKLSGQDSHHPSIMLAISKKCAARWRLRRARLGLLKCIRNRVDEVHRKMVAWLVDMYPVVKISPSFETQAKWHPGRMADDVCIPKLRVACAFTWAHYRFRQRLLQAGQSSGLGTNL